MPSASSVDILPRHDHSITTSLYFLNGKFSIHRQHTYLYSSYMGVPPSPSPGSRAKHLIHPAKVQWVKKLQMQKKKAIKSSLNWLTIRNSSRLSSSFPVCALFLLSLQLRFFFFFAWRCQTESVSSAGDLSSLNWYVLGTCHHWRERLPQIISQWNFGIVSAPSVFQLK